MKSNNSILLSLLVAGAMAILSSTNVHSQEPEPIGLMLSTVGVVTAEDVDGNVRRLQRRSAVFEGDTLITANRARAQVRFNDRGLVALQPNTSFFIEEHNFDGQEDGTESAVYSLLRGGLQAITGLIGRTNRDRYQVSTPIATIGLRGTHWAATFCTDECDGNAPGLYGGVADGGIDVCNGGGCTAVETNAYFYTPDANTQATTLLAPPSVVFAAVEDTEDEDEGEEAEAVAATDGETPADGDDDTTTSAAEDGEAPTTEATADIATFVETAGASDDDELQNVLSGVTSDDGLIRALTGLEDTSEVVAENRETVVEEEITAATQTTPAPAGAVVALASARGNPDDADQSAALEILVYPSGDSPNEDEFSLPVAGFVDAVDPADEMRTTTALGALAFNLSQAGCDPCLYATAGLQGTSAELVDSFETTVDGVDVFLGRWSGDALLFNSGFDNANGDLNALQDHHYAIALSESGFAFSPALPSAQDPEIAVFSLLEATEPTDQDSNTGTLDTFDLYMDLYMQLVTKMDISISFDDREISAGLVNAFGFSEGAVAGLSAPLTGTCSGDGCGTTTSLFGTTSLSLIGSSSEHILGSYALDSVELDQSVFGAYLLGRELTFNPLQVSDLVGVEQIENVGLLAGTEQVGSLFQPILANLAVLSGSDGQGFAELVSLYDTSNVLAAQSSNSVSFDVIDGELIERGSIDLSFDTFHYGTWRLTDFAYSENDQEVASNGTFNYLYALNAAPEDYSDREPLVYSYIYAGGPSPVDENGNLGQIKQINLGFDAWHQTVDYFEMELEIAARMYEADLISVADLAEVITGSPLLLSGTCTGGDCSAVGEVVTGSANLSLFFIGEGIDGAVGSFGLQSRPVLDSSVVVSSETFDGVLAVDAVTPPSEHTASGLFVLEGAAETHPDLLSQSDAIVVDEGIAALSVTGTDGTNFAPLGTVQSGETANIGLEDLGDRTNLLVSFEDADEPEDEGGSFTLNQGVLESYEASDSFIADYAVDSGSPDFSVNIGRWTLLDSDLVVQGESVDNTGVGHFAFSSAPTDLDALRENPFEIGAPILRYSLVDSTRPSDESDNLGVLHSADLEVDLYHQLISDFSLALSIGGRSMEAWLHVPTALGENEIDLLGECSGGVCLSGTSLSGDFSIGFVGTTAEGVIGNFGLYSNQTPPLDDEIIYSEISANGAFVLARDSIDPHPDYVDGSGFAVADSGIAALSTTVLGDGTFAPIGTTEAIPSVEIGLVDLGARTDLVVDFLSVDSEPGEDGSFSVNEALLREYRPTPGFIATNQISDETGVLSSSADFDVSIGRWELIDSEFVLNGDVLDTRPEAHFGFSDTPTNMDTFLSNPFSIKAPIVSYSLVDATAPTGQDGNRGNLTSVILEADLYLQLITDFSMELGIGAAKYDAWLYAPTYFDDAMDYGGVKLAGYCEFGECGDDEGTDLLGFAGLGLIGETGEGVIGNYELVEDMGVLPIDGNLVASNISANGVFVLARDSVIQNPYFFDGNDALVLQNTGQAFAFAGQVGEGEDLYPLAEAFSSADSDDYFSILGELPAVYSYFNGTSYGDFYFSINDEQGALLAEKDLYEDFGDDLVVWGRWLALDGYDFEFDDEILNTGTDAHFIWSDAQTDSELFGESSPQSASYSFFGGTSPTDEQGAEGVVNFINLDLDLFQQAIVSFDMEIKVSDRYYNAHMLENDSTYYLDGVSADNLELAGLCTGGIGCGDGVEIEGRTSMVFVGDSAAAESFDQMSGVIGSYALEASMNEGDEEENLKDLLNFDDYRITEVDLGEEFDYSQISVAGTYFLLGEASDNELYFDSLASSPPTLTVGSGVAAVVSGVQSMYYPYDVNGHTSIIGGIDDTGAPIDDDIFLTSLGSTETIDNLVVGFDSYFMEEDMYGYPTEYLEQFRIDEGVLAEQGGFGSFLSDNNLLTDGATDFGINWGRWFAYASYAEGEYAEGFGFVTPPDEEILGMDHHFVYTDGESGITPVFDDPTEARYSYVGGTSPTDEWGRTGVMDADLYLDLYTQTLSNFEMNIEIGERRIYAQYDRYNYSPYQTSELDIDLEELLDEGIRLRGICVGGICDEGMDYYYGNESVRLSGSADFMPFGPNGEGFFGGFELQEDEDEGSYYPEISVFGTFVLAQDETRDHIGWQVDPGGTDAAADSVAVMSGSLIPDDVTPAFAPFASVADLTAGDSFTTITIEDRSNIVDSVLESNLDCMACKFEVQDAVVILTGDVHNEYQYIDTPAEVSWATWANQDILANEWLFDDMSTALDSSRLLSTIFADNHTSAAELMSAVPLTGYIDDDPTAITAHYRYAGGPSPVYYNGAAADPEDRMEFARVNTIDLGVDFLSQTVDYFDVDIRVGEDYYSSVEIDLGLVSAETLAPTTFIELSGSCVGCGSSSYDEEYLVGHAEIAFVGDRAEQVIGGLAAWSDGTNYYGSMIPNYYAVEAGFVLNQDFDEYWVEASELRVGEPAMAAIAPSFLLDSTLGSLLPLVIVDDLTNDDVQLELTEFNRPYGGATIDVFTGFSSPADFLNIEEGRLWDYGRAFGGQMYSYESSDEDPWFVADWGVWESESYNFSLPSDPNHASATDIQASALMPFVTSRDLTLELPDGIVTGGMGTTAQFVLLDAPETVDLFGGTGYIEEILMEFDFATASVVDFYLTAKDQYYHRFDMELAGATADPITDTRFQLSLTGVCDSCVSGGSTANGAAVFTFLGDNAEGAAGSFGLESSGYFLSGAYILHQNDHWMDLPDTFAAEQGGVVAFTATEDDPLAGNTHGFYIDGTNTAELLTVQSFDHTHPNALAGFESASAPCGDCSWDMTQGELRDYDNTNGQWDYLPEAYWGRWESQDQLEVDGVATALTQYQHFAYSPDPSQYTDDIWANAVSGEGTWLVDYDHTNPTYTDSTGNSFIAYGGLDVDLQLNYFEQQIDSFTMDIYNVDGLDYYTSAAGPVALDASAPFANIPVTGYTETYGTSSTISTDVIGTSSVFIIGVDADAAIGTYDVVSPTIGNYINGAFFLGED